ncbi:MAG: ATP-binding protein, partial [Bacteroidota bacterium]
IDYIIRVINLIRQSSSQEEALLTLRKGTFIAEPKAFESQFAAILPGEILASNEPAEDGNVYLLSEEQAQAILNLSFGQLLGLKNRSRNEGENVPTLSLEESQVLAMAYLDSMKQIGTGIIVDQGYLLSFATNQFGWLMVNQSTNEQYMAPIMAKNEFISDRFDSIKSRIFWFSLLSGLFFLGLFVLLTTGILYRFVRPINQLVEVVAETRREAGKAVEDIEEDATFEFLGESFAELSQDLKTYINKLELSNQELEQYAHVIAHDLREPLRMVSSYVGLLARRHKDDFDEASDEYVHYAIQGTKRMDQMIRDVLDYATLNQKLNAVEKEVVDLNQSVEQAVEMLQNKIEDSGAGIKIEPLPKVMGKASYLTLVFQNLIENAIKYRLPEVAPEIEISARQEEAEWILTIKDNGRGFPEEALEQIFEMFKRWNEPKNEESSGIGLATCVRIMADHGGRVWADSPGEGRGANFYLSFPASPNE